MTREGDRLDSKLTAKTSLIGVEPVGNSNENGDPFLLITVAICTFTRTESLRRTLASLTAMRLLLSWVLYRICRFVSPASVWIKFLKTYSWNKGIRAVMDLIKMGTYERTRVGTSV